MNTLQCISALQKHQQVFLNLLKGTHSEAVKWKPEQDSWCLLEVICHLHDEERDDFRFRVDHTLHNPGVPAPLFDQLAWVEEHKYLEQDFDGMLARFLEEREHSVQWLKSLRNPNWNSGYQHPKLGFVSAKYFLTNWVAHDLLHIRQIIRLQFQYHQNTVDNGLEYAGTW